MESNEEPREEISIKKKNIWLKIFYFFVIIF